MIVYFSSLGCPKNTVDMEGTLALLKRGGCSFTCQPEEADLLILNACSFLSSAWKETEEELSRLAAFKRTDGKKKLALMGCLPVHMDVDLRGSWPDIDYIIPAGEHGKLPELIKANGSNKACGGSGVDPFAGYLGREVITPSHAAYVKIAEGCSQRCSFCTIPLIKGPYKTRNPEEIRTEVELLSKHGVKEITVIAQDTAAYDYKGTRLPELVESLALTGIDWIRLLYVHPASIPIHDLIGIFDNDKVCRYLDIPVQHASDRILHSMQRGYSLKYMLKLFEELKNHVPGIVFRSELIVGYPGEEEDDFEILKSFVEEVEFTSLGVFPFSPEPGTRAATLNKAVPEEVTAQRASELRSLEESVAFSLNSARVGERLEVMVDRIIEKAEGHGGSCSLAGRYYGQAPEIDGEVRFSGDSVSPGQFVSVEVTDADAFDILGLRAR